MRISRVIKTSVRLLFSLSLICVSCHLNPSREDKISVSNGKYLIKRHDEQGRIKTEFFLNRKGQKDSLYKTYFANGKISEWFNFSHDTLNGEQKTYYSNGIPRSWSYYKGSYIDSCQKWFYENGVLKSEYNWTSGKKFGLQKQFDSTGKLRDAYFITSCDSCMTLDLKIGLDGRVIGKEGNLIACFNNGNNISLGDTVKILFYTIILDSYDQECKLIEKNNGTFVSREKVVLSKYNNNWGYLLIKEFNKKGSYSLGLSVDLISKVDHSRLSDSLFTTIHVADGRIN